MRKLPTKTPSVSHEIRVLKSPFVTLPSNFWRFWCLLIFSFGTVVTLQADVDETRLVKATLERLQSQSETPAQRLAIAALEQTFIETRYVPAYVSIPYPMGDVPKGTGVCTDVVVRAYRALGIDLQEKVHVDMKANFSKYPKIWGLKRTDTNIDHRRVPNLRVFLERQGASLKVTDDASRYQVGDLVTSTVPPHLPHIAVVVPSPSGRGTPWIVHNIGRGAKYENRLFEFPITGHYRWLPAESKTSAPAAIGKKRSTR